MLYWDKKLTSSALTIIAECRDKLLFDLTRLLNEFHRVKKSTHYYDLIAGDWLESFTHITCAAMLEVLANNNKKYLVDSPIPVAADLISHSWLRTNESGLHEHLRSAVAHLLERGKPIDWKFSSESVCIDRADNSSLRSKLIRSAATTNPKVLMVDTNFRCSLTEFSVTMLGWRKWVKLDQLQYPINIKVEIDRKWRISRASEASNPKDLLGLLRVLIPLHLPVALLEGFSAFRDATMAMPVNRPKILYSATALHDHLTFKLLAAEWRDYGTHLLYHQHGGGYGTDIIHTPEKYETRVSDRYFTWGWSNVGNSKVSPMSPPVSKSLSYKPKFILLLCTNFPKVVYRIHYHPMPGRIQNMHLETFEFLKSLPRQDEILIRPYQKDFGWGFHDRMREVAPHATFDRFEFGISQRYAQSQLVVHNYLGTSYLETLALNVPTVCFYDSDVYEFRPEARILIDVLENVGIVHQSGKSAARFVAGLGDDIQGWWMQPEVQAARNAFANKYANFSVDWKQQWEMEFQRAIDLGNKTLN